MKKAIAILVFTYLVLCPVAASPYLDAFLEKIGASEIRLLQNESIYDSILEVYINQPLDHHNPEAGSFRQRIYISHIDPAEPVVLSMAGYEAPYYYTTEIAAELRCNQIFVEHRFFGKSIPDSLDWSLLDTWQAASDHHRIIDIFNELYSGPWITTGISKGGQAVMYHSYHYPEDVELRVPYVAPLNYGLEDPRIYSFLNKVGPFLERNRVKRFQRMALKNQEIYRPSFMEISDEKGYSYTIAGGAESAFEYCVLEYSFAYWQWGYAEPKDIPRKNASPMEVVEHMNRVAGFDYFSDNSILDQRPFWYQAMTEMGYYGYDLEDFSKQLKHVNNPRFTFTLSPEMDSTFHPQLSIDVRDYLLEDGNNFIYVYGEYDTWSATAVRETGYTNSKIFFKKKGSHRTRINNMPEAQKEKVYDVIREMLGT